MHQSVVPVFPAKRLIIKRVSVVVPQKPGINSKKRENSRGGSEPRRKDARRHKMDLGDGEFRRTILLVAGRSF